MTDLGAGYDDVRIPLPCSGDHRRHTDAVAAVSFPDGRFNAERACVGHLDFLVRLALDEGVAVLVTPIGARRD